MGSTGCLLEVSSEPVDARKGPGLLREVLQRAFSLYSDVSQCASVISAPETVCLSSVFEGNSVFACQEFGVCGYVCVCHRHVCRWFTLNLALNTVLIQKQLFRIGKMVKAAYSILISSLQSCYVKKKVKEALSFFFSMPLPAFPSIFALHFSPLQHLHTLRCFQSLPRGAEQLTPLLPALLYYSALLFRLLWW